MNEDMTIQDYIIRPINYIVHDLNLALRALTPTQPSSPLPQSITTWPPLLDQVLDEHLHGLELLPNEPSSFVLKW